jgi:hypothetical protein
VDDDDEEEGEEGVDVEEGIEKNEFGETKKYRRRIHLFWNVCMMYLLSSHLFQKRWSPPFACHSLDFLSYSS